MIRCKITKFGKYNGPHAGQLYYWGSKSRTEPIGVLLITGVRQDKVEYIGIFLGNNQVDDTYSVSMKEYEVLRKGEFWSTEEEFLQ